MCNLFDPTKLRSAERISLVKAKSPRFFFPSARLDSRTRAITIQPTIVNFFINCTTLSRTNSSCARGESSQSAPNKLCSISLAPACLLLPPSPAAQIRFYLDLRQVGEAARARGNEQKRRRFARRGARRARFSCCERISRDASR